VPTNQTIKSRQRKILKEEREREREKCSLQSKNQLGKNEEMFDEDHSSDQGEEIKNDRRGINPIPQIREILSRTLSKELATHWLAHCSASSSHLVEFIHDQTPNAPMKQKFSFGNGQYRPKIQRIIFHQNNVTE
jgi:beta-phosphoglucomutase-like phosphatase (HAD superfamily)